MELFLVRHGVTQLNADRIFMGHDPVPLSPEGRQQVRLLAERLREAGFDRLISSDIARARESAEILAAAVGREIEAHAALREIDVGRAKGFGYAEAAERWPEVFAADGAGRFPDGESFAEVADRAATFLRSEVVARAGRGERVLAVAHGGVIRGVAARFLELPLAVATPFVIDNASLSIFRFDRGATQLVTWNDTGHLGIRRRLAPGELAGTGG